MTHPQPVVPLKENKPVIPLIEEAAARYEILQKLLDKALIRSRQSIDVSSTVTDIYAEDATMFQGEDENMLSSIFETMLDKVNARVKEEMIQVLKEEDVENRLSKLEAIVQRLAHEEREQREAEQFDSDSARKAFEEVKLPQDVTPRDLLSYHAYVVMQEERNSLRHQLEVVEGVIKGLRENQEHTNAEAEANVRSVQKAAKELERSADVCSMVS